ncbi:MAG: hypothetical protein PHQ27_05335, partial [Victivallales bacterium]|nr:hypothetical protein [Victivallales bacterium]
PNIRLEFNYTKDTGDQVSYVAVNPQDRSETPTEPRPEIKAPAGKNHDRRFTGQFLVTRSNLPTSIWVGNIAVDQTWLEFVRRYPKHNLKLKNGKLPFPRTGKGKPPLTEINAAIYLKPTWRQDDIIDVELYPEIHCHDAFGNRENIKVEQLAITVRMKEGEKMLFRDIFQRGKENFDGIFGPEFLQRQDMRRITSMTLSATRTGDNYRHFPAAMGKTPRAADTPAIRPGVTAR